MSKGDTQPPMHSGRKRAGAVSHRQLELVAVQSKRSILSSVYIFNSSMSRACTLLFTY